MNEPRTIAGSLSVSTGGQARRAGRTPPTRRDERPFHRARVAGDDGTVLVLAIGLVTICAAVLLAAVDVAALHLQRRSAELSADGAARAAAQALDLAKYYGSSDGDRLVLDLGKARSRALAYLADDGGRWRLEGLRVEADQVVVDVTGRRRLPFTGTWAPDGVDVRGAASAELTVVD